MAAIEDLTFDLSTARRPSLEDLGGVGFVDDEAHPPPRDGTYLYKEVLIQLVKQVHALAKMVPLFRMTVTFSAGTPSIVSVDSPGDNLVAGDFTITDNGVGDTTIAWAAGKLPPVSTGPLASSLYSTSNPMSVAPTFASTTSIRVVTLNNGVAVDAPFTVQL